MNKGSHVMHLYHKSCHLFYSGISLIYVAKHERAHVLAFRHMC